MAELPLDVVDARALHGEVCVLDLHADTPKLMDKLGFDISVAHDRPMPGRLNYVGHVDLPRLREGGMAGQFFGLWTVPYPERGCAASVHATPDASTGTAPCASGWASASPLKSSTPSGRSRRPSPSGCREHAIVVAPGWGCGS